MNSNNSDWRPLDTFLKHRESLVDYATPLVGDRMRAEDVVQEAWFRFSSAIEKDRGSAEGDARPIAQPVAYLYRIVRNLAFDLKRKLNAEAWHPSGEAVLDGLASENASPEQQTVDRHQLKTVSNALDELPARTRRAFDLHRFEGKTYAEIGELLGISQARAHGLVKEAVVHCIKSLSAQTEK